VIWVQAITQPNLGREVDLTGWTGGRTEIDDVIGMPHHVPLVLRVAVGRAVALAWHVRWAIGFLIL